LLELQALETKNNIQDMINKAQLSQGAIEGDKYTQAIELLNERYRNIEYDYLDTKTKAGMMFGKLGESVQQLYGRLPETGKTLSPPPRTEESKGEGSSSEPPPETPLEFGTPREDEDEEDQPQDKEEKDEEEEKPVEKRTIYYGEKSMYSNLNKLIGIELSGRLRSYLTDEGMDKKAFVKQMYTDNPQIGYAEDTTERKDLVREYIETIMGIKKRGKKK
jgi:hypothetical protein